MASPGDLWRSIPHLRSEMWGTRQNYTLEPNVRFSPDGRLVIFTGNMTGTSYVYAVEVGKAQPTTTTP